MTTLQEIESASCRLPRQEQRKLLAHLLVQIGSEDGAQPQPERFSDQGIYDWIHQDELDRQSLDKST